MQWLRIMGIGLMLVVFGKVSVCRHSCKTSVKKLLAVSNITTTTLQSPPPLLLLFSKYSSHVASLPTNFLFFATNF